LNNILPNKVFKQILMARRLLSVFSTGQVAEYELIYAVNYMLHFADMKPQNYTFTLIREYQDDPRQVLAKTRELNLVLNELRQEAAATIYQRLPAHLAQLQGR
jgi:LPS-assembly lipoprotein